MNFLVFDLCDNDYGHNILRAVEYAIGESFEEYAGEDCKWWKAFVIEFIGASMLLTRFKSEESIEGSKIYLENRLTVYSSRHWPTHDGTIPLDHDGGSVVLDLNTKIATLI